MRKNKSKKIENNIRKNNGKNILGNKNNKNILKTKNENINILNKKKERSQIQNNFFKLNFEKNHEDNINPKKINFSYDIVKNAFVYKYFYLDNTFTIFISVNDIIILIYTNKDKSIITFNLNDFKILNEIKKAHNAYITNFRHYLDKNNNRDLVISISKENNNIKLWDINNFKCLINFENINKYGELYSACFLNDNNQIYIITSNFNNYGCESIKIFNLNKKKIKEIKDSNYSTYFIDSYFDNKWLYM